MKFLKKYYALLTALISFIFYLLTLAPSVIQIDAGELAAVQATAGIAHPTGYPLFTMTGYLFLNLPLPLSKILLANLLAAVWCSLGIFFFTVILKFIYDNKALFIIQKKTEKKKHNKSKVTISTEPGATFAQILEFKQYLAIIAAGLLLAFNETYWLQATSVEVYSLHIYLITFTIYLLLRAYKSNSRKDWIFFSISLALGFSNHMTTLLLIPGAAYLYFDKNRFSKGSFIQILIMLGVFFPILILMYSYLPIRASQNPILNWGNPIDMERILRHISGKQYQVWLFSSTESARKQLEYFITSLPGEFAIVGLLFIVVGIFQTFIVAKKFFIFVLICFLTTVFYSINYDINDIDSYFLLAYISLAFFSTFGINKLLGYLKNKPGDYAAPGIIIAVFLVTQLYINYKKCDQSDCYTYNDYTKAVMKSSGSRSIIFSYQWDYFISPSYYFQLVEELQPGTVIIDKELLRRSWYYDQLNNAYPNVMKGIASESRLFLDALKPFERDLPYNAAVLESNYQLIMQKLITENIQTHSYFIGPELVDNEMRNGAFSLPKGYFIVPDLLLFRVVSTNEYVPAADPDFRIRFPKNSNKYIEQIKNMVGSMLVRRAMYELSFDKTERARLYINKIRKEMPEYRIPYELENVF